MADNNFSQNIDTIFNDIQNYVKNESMMGNPVVVEDKTLVPLVTVTLGYGSGMAIGGSAKSQSSETSPVGIGARISTSGVVVINKDNVSMLPANEKGSMTNIVDKLPQMISSFKQSGSSGSQGSSQQDNSMQNMFNQPTQQ